MPAHIWGTAGSDIDALRAEHLFYNETLKFVVQRCFQFGLVYNFTNCCGSRRFFFFFERRIINEFYNNSMQRQFSFMQHMILSYSYAATVDTAAAEIISYLALFAELMASLKNAFLSCGWKIGPELRL
jgi:hypothetical protein